MRLGKVMGYYNISEWDVEQIMATKFNILFADGNNR
jgi:prepilin-type processing-associated H-X9-DG protein